MTPEFTASAKVVFAGPQYVPTTASLIADQEAIEASMLRTYFVDMDPPPRTLGEAMCRALRDRIERELLGVEELEE